MLTHICISDLHAGAITSLLTHLDQAEDGSIQPKPGQVSPVTTAFSTAMEQFLRAAGAENAPPQLILLGDAFDLQFSDRQHACLAAGQFLGMLRQNNLLSGDVIATAGNHDHSLWTDARASLLSRSLRPDPSGKIPAAMEATPAFLPTPAADSRLLRTVLTNVGFANVDFRYPNIGFANDDRVVVFHHGHFVEDTYRVMSHVKTALAGLKHRKLSVEDLASENVGWLDFAWSSLGDAAGIGRGAETLYQNFLTSTGSRRLSKRWANRIGEALSRALPMSGNLSLRAALKTAARVALDVTIGKFRDTERYHEVFALSPEGREGVKWYLEGPTLTQIEAEDVALSEDVSFVFGHTHKPFSERISAQGFQNAVKVFNTGGWTLNGPRLDNAEGAALVLMDDDLNVASLRLFMTPRDGVVPPVSVEILSDTSEAEAFKAEIESWLAETKDVWDALSETVRVAYELRQNYLLDLTADADVLPLQREAAE